MADLGATHTESKIFNAICESIRKHPEDVLAYRDAFACLSDSKYSVKKGRIVRQLIARAIAGDFLSARNITSLVEIDRSILMTGARYSFDDYMQAVEYDRPRNAKFYLPRRHFLKQIVDAYQNILDGKIKVLTVSQPKRTGKSQTEINFVNMISGLHPEGSTLIEGAGDALVNSFYKGCLEYLTDLETYNYYEIFPDAKLVDTSADMKTFNLNTKSRFPTCMCRSISATQVGLSEATNLLVLDDCVLGREEAMNRDLLDKKWEIISGDVIGRDVGMIAPIVMTGTRYSLYDPIGRLQDECLKNDWPHQFIEIPALDLKTDESNFEYEKDGKKIFTTQYFRDQRNMLSAEQFESEFQQQPIEAHGLLFPKDDLNYFFELPTDKAPDAVVAYVDPAGSGEDSTSMPVAYLFGQDVYIEDVVFDKSPAIITKGECARMIVKHKIGVTTCESNNGGDFFARDIEKACKALGYRASIRTRRTTGNKQAKIEFASDNIMKKFYFKDWSLLKPGSQYFLFMRELTTYVRSGKVPHDDAPDALSMLENMLRSFIGGTYTISERPF